MDGERSGSNEIERQGNGRMKHQAPHTQSPRTATKESFFAHVFLWMRFALRKNKFVGTAWAHVQSNICCVARYVAADVTIFALICISDDACPCVRGQAQLNGNATPIDRPST